jgi:hypothetical protein
MKNEVIIRLFNSRRGVIAKPFICQAGTAGTVSGHFFTVLSCRSYEMHGRLSGIITMYLETFFYYLK